MTINFKSIYTFEGEKKIIEFSSNLHKDFVDNIHILEFDETRGNQTIKNRIEYDESTLKIFTGPSTLEMELNQVVKNSYQTPHGSFFIYAKLNSIDIYENKAIFQYEIGNDKDSFINSFLLELSFIK